MMHVMFANVKVFYPLVCRS